MSQVAEPATAEQAAQQIQRFRKDVRRLRDEIARVIVGHEEIVEGVVIALLSGGHVLLEGVPG
ncbi:MAG TPA: AAA family ATPase, partial [Pseudomonadota bacterium]|nr:AAA family ATPase [Pseudomonadota bacterium]